MASHSQGIQQLLAAEKKASEKVQEARKRKQRRLKQAKEEAQEEIKKYKAEREQKFKLYEQQHMGSQGDVVARIDSETNEKKSKIDKRVDENKEDLIEYIVNLVLNIKPQVHKNARLVEKIEKDNTQEK